METGIYIQKTKKIVTNILRQSHWKHINSFAIKYLQRNTS